AKRVTKKDGRIIVVESVYGLKDYDPGLEFGQQLLLNVFFDHFYNRIIHYSEYAENKINVPFNFQTPQNWKKFFAKNGLRQEEVIMLGFDQPTVPEYHTLHILKVEK
ncbi:MAG: hypothetical protein Q7K42_00495, partial [Candidatus Diapherotrites archaeon]|nr:hypothetical protein [Candidatus Diapherotrites archaeon]